MADYQINPMTRLLREDKKSVLYRPTLRRMVDSVTGALLLSQILYWFDRNHSKPFYKFAAPCEHAKYNKGDSWQEELGFTRYELEGALAKIGTKCGRGTDKETLRKTHDDQGNLAPVGQIVLYWRDSDNVTWYELNERLLELHLQRVYSELECGKVTSANVEKPHYLECGKTTLPENVEKPHYPYTETTREYTENLPAPLAQGADEPLPIDASAQAEPRKGRKVDLMYEAIQAVFGFEGALNGKYRKWLEGTATRKDGQAYLDANMEVAVTPDELRAWWAWYCKQQPNPEYRVKEVAKIQESILAYRRSLQSRPVVKANTATRVTRYFVGEVEVTPDANGVVEVNGRKLIPSWVRHLVNNEIHMKF